MTLEKNGYNVVIAVSGEEALSLIRAGEKFDLVLMDIDLGRGMDGTMAAEFILNEIDIPLVFMSSHTEKQIVDKTEGITSYGYIVKNSGETVMLTSIKMAFKLFDARMAEVGMLKATSIWEKTINSINNSILLIDSDYRIIKYNKAFSDFVRGNGQDLRGLKCMELVHGQSCIHEACPLLRMKESLKRERAEMVIHGRAYEVIVDPIFDRLGKLEGAVHIIADVSDYKRVNKELEERISLLARSSEVSEPVSFEKLFDLEKIQKLQDDFADAHGIASIITLPDGTPITRASNFSRFCFGIVRQTEEGLESCLKSDAELGIPSDKGPTIKKCSCFGLWDAGAGITVDGAHIANWLIGQVRDESVNESELRSGLRKIGADEAGSIQAYYKLPVMSQNEFCRVADLLYTMAETLSESAYRNFQQARMITRISESEEKIQQLLNEKNILLKEVHHRVKNNISSLGALLTMQLEFTKQPEAVSAIKDAIARVNSTRVLYEKLLKSDKYTDLPVRQFVEDIYREISLMFDDESQTRVSISIDDFFLSSDQLFPLGIIINELLTNIFKHAFILKDEGEIYISIRSEDDLVMFEIQDNGKGLPDNLSMESPDSFGLKLVKMLTKQINADLIMENRSDGKHGTVCRLKMKPDGAPLC